MSDAVGASEAQIAAEAADVAPVAEAAGEAVRTPLPLRACAAEGTMSDEVAGLGPDLSNEAWQAEIARREGELRPTDEKFGPCKVPTPHRKPPKKPPVAPRRGVSANPDKIGARRAIQMGQRASGGTTLDAAALLLRAASDPASTVRIEVLDGRVLDAAKLSPHCGKEAIIGEGGVEHPFENIHFSFFAWVKWLAANGHVGFRPGKKAWRESVRAEPAPAVQQAAATERPRARKPGPKPAVRQRVIGAMLADFRSGKWPTMDELKNEKQDALASDYGVNRETVCRAREAVLSELSEIGTPTNGSTK